jgi:hypothetical protein
MVGIMICHEIDTGSTWIVKTSIVKAHVLTFLLVSLLMIACSTVPETVSNHASGVARSETTPEMKCTAKSTSNGRVVVHYQLKNVSPDTIYVPFTDRMPYLISEGIDTLVIMYGINSLDPSIIYHEHSEIPKMRSLGSSELLIHDIALGGALLHDHFHVKPTPSSLLHGVIHVRCVAGWSTTQLNLQHISLEQLLAWQHTTSYGPFDVVLP